jgi:hypothetical protein
VRVFYDPAGAGCQVTVSEGYLAAYCDDHPGTSLRGLTGLTVLFGKDFDVRDVRVKDGPLGRWRAGDLAHLVRLARDIAKKRTISGTRPVVQPPAVEPSQTMAEVSPEPKSEPTLRPGFEAIPGRYVIVRRGGARVGLGAWVVFHLEHEHRHTIGFPGGDDFDQGKLRIALFPVVIALARRPGGLEGSISLNDKKGPFLVRNLRVGGDKSPEDDSFTHWLRVNELGTLRGLDDHGPGCWIDREGA